MDPSRYAVRSIELQVMQKQKMNRKLLTSIFVVILFVSGCGGDYELRGKVVPSEDGKTYLVVEDDNGGQCGPMLLDGKPWPHAIGQRGLVSPGEHQIHCGGSIVFTVSAGTTFHFDYWGP